MVKRNSEETIFNGSKVIYSAGCYIAPCLCADGKYRWVVTEFDEASFEDGEVFNPLFLSHADVNVLESVENTGQDLEDSEPLEEEDRSIDFEYSED